MVRTLDEGTQQIDNPAHKSSRKLLTTYGVLATNNCSSLFFLGLRTPEDHQLRKDRSGRADIWINLSAAACHEDCLTCLVSCWLPRVTLLGFGNGSVRDAA